VKGNIPYAARPGVHVALLSTRIEMGMLICSPSVRPSVPYSVSLAKVLACDCFSGQRVTLTITINRKSVFAQ